MPARRRPAQAEAGRGQGPAGLLAGPARRAGGGHTQGDHRAAQGRAGRSRGHAPQAGVRTQARARAART